MMNVVEYVIEEVRRQGHDVTRLNGLQRVGWLLEAWCTALTIHWPPTLDDVALLGSIVEPLRNPRSRGGFRRCDVKVGRANST